MAAPAPDRAPFGPRARWLFAAAAVSLAAAAVLGMFGDVLEVPSYGADSFSRSAIGHHAFVQLARALGREVAVSRARTAERGAGAVVVVAEPLIGPATMDVRSREKLDEMLAQARGVLLVLPKRAGMPAKVRPGWLGGVLPLPAAIAERILEAASIPGTVIRPQQSARCVGALPAPDLQDPQLVVSTDLAPVLSCGDGVLVGERTSWNGTRILVLSDPDVLATHGLGRGRNAELVAALLDRLDPGGRAPIVVDETLHGHEIQPSIARQLLSWPLALATLQAAIALGLLAWAALVRSGRPRRAGAALAPGKEFLVENTAQLLRHGRHLAPAVASYWRAAKEQIVRALHPGARPADLDGLLARLAAARGRAEELAGLERRVAQLSSRRPLEHEALRAALDVHAFREVMTHGARRDP